MNVVVMDDTFCGRSWDSLNDYGTTIAVVATVCEIGDCGIDSDIPIDSDVVFNSLANWDVYDGPERLGVIDFKRAVLHEFGHVAGLGHSEPAGPVAEAIMHSDTSDLYTIQQDDEEGLAAKYP